MKKILTVLLILTLAAATLSFTASAAPAQATLTGPDIIRPGDRFTVTFRLDGNSICGMEANLVYDPEKVTLVETTQLISGDWLLEINDGRLIAYDNTMSAPVNAATDIFSATFQVKDLAEGDAIHVSVEDIIATDSNSDQTVDNAVFEGVIAPPLSTDCTLASLTVSNADVTPAFGASTILYQTSVPYEVSKLDISAVASDPKATVSIHNTDLIPDGTTDVTVTVTAEDGTVKTYTIRVHRAKDPNYVPSSNSYLKNILVDEFRLSPSFDRERYEYVIWLPYEVESVNIRGEAEDSKGSVAVEGGDNLISGADNPIRIICTAENGTQRTYIVVAIREASHDSPATQPTEPTAPSTQPTEPENDPLPSPSQGSTAPSQTPAPSEPSDETPNGTNPLLIVLICVLSVIAIAGIVVIVLVILGTKRQGRFSK